MLTAGLGIENTTLSLSTTNGGSLNGSTTDATFTTGADATLNWTNANGATAYDLLIYDVNIGQEVLNLPGLQSNSHSPATLTNASRYQAFVRGTGSGQVGNWSSPVFFDVTGQPQATNSLPGTPSFSGLTADTPPALSWTSASNAASYDLLVYNVLAGQEVLNLTGLTTTEYSPSSLLNSSDEFQAFVRAANSNGDVGSWSSPFNFHGTGQSQIPASPVFTGLTNTTPPQIAWQHVDGAASYELLVYSMTNGQEVLRQDGLSGTSYTPFSLFGTPDNYQAFIRAANSNGDYGLWGGPLEFRLESDSQFPAAPHFVSLPTVESPVITWSTLTGAASYELQIYSVDTGQIVLGQSSIAETQFDVTTLQQNPGMYQAFVRGFDGFGNFGHWSSPETFEVVTPPPVTNPDPEITPDPGPGTGSEFEPEPDPGGETGGQGGGSTGEEGNGNGEGSGSPDLTFQEIFDLAMESVHGPDLAGKDGPLGVADHDLAVLYHETLLGIPHSTYLAPQNMDFQIQDGNVLVNITTTGSGGGSSSEFHEEGSTGFDGGSSTYSDGEQWIAITDLIDVAADPAVIDIAPVWGVVQEDDWVLGLAAGANPSVIASQLGVGTLTPTGVAPNTYSFQIPESANLAAVFNELQTNPQVLFFDALVAQQDFVRAVPSDPLFVDQWHLWNVLQSGGLEGEDVNVIDVWDNYRGNGVTIGIVDEGVDHLHEDLIDNFNLPLSFDFNDKDPDPMPEFLFEGHGTAVAGVAGARGFNGIGVSGSAPEATLAGLRLIAAPNTPFDEADALSHESQNIDIYNNSWGPPDIGFAASIPSITEAAIENGVNTGRGGLGNIYVWAAGNGLQSNDNVNYDEYASSRYTIAVGAIGHEGRQAFYSEPGAAMLVTAHSGTFPLGNPPSLGVDITTTDVTGIGGFDIGNYTSDFNGTSSSTPLVSGVIALMLEANPNLTWRDVQHILVESARKNDPFDPGWVTNGAGKLVNHKFGFGAVDAEAAVNMALTWTNVAPEVSAGTGVINVGVTMADNSPIPVVSSREVFHDITLETVEITVDVDHTYRGDLRISLVSPAGTVSQLAEPRVQDSAEDYVQYTFSSVQHWGESSTGVWTILMSDEQAQDIGTFNSWELTFHGTGQVAPDFPPGWTVPV
ncbi:MAG: hypothetical protein Tsb009_07820 [Planctomycetaceae bacterium]